MKKYLIIIISILFYQFSGLGQEIPAIFTPIKIAENLYAIENAKGGNIAFLVTTEGIVVVDAGSRPSNGKDIIESIRSVSDKPIKFVIYTHLHGDHIFGISAFPSEAKIIAYEKLDANIKSITEPILKKSIEIDFPDFIYGLGEELAAIENEESDEYKTLKGQLDQYSAYLQDLKQIKIRYPDTLFIDKYELLFGGERIILEFPGSGHTNDNIIVRFPKQNTIHTGDLIFNGRFPYVLATHGATVKGWIAVMDKLSAEKIQNVIPGHGKITNSDVFKTQATYFKKLTEKVLALKNQGKNIEEIKSLIDIKEFELKGNEDQFPIHIEVIYSEL
ncbi:MAG: hypothetical protein A2W99_00660 [Bacteroidetes bacterium GWF2_33_16]|nr:MAG: hypothetical protein A2X00_03365 [Bacteroidetes bacterium GWE2_32_14]OFY08778.1 MAG: hypothetical protein A2W99_00660 [Bacteroidetes bacterium GWF2_33_16]